MSTHVDPLPPRSRVLRLNCAVAAVMATSVLSAGLLAGWHVASAPMWLLPTQDVVAELTACERAPDPLVRDRCKRGIVTARSTTGTAPVRLAQR